MANPDPIRVSNSVVLVPGAVNCALIHNERGEALLFDTGQDRNYARRIRRALDTCDLTPIAIVNSHAHADHFGGNTDLVRRYDIPVLAPAFEASLMASPYLEPVYLFHGARPPAELTTPWLQAPPSPVDIVLETGPFTLLDGVDIEAIDTSGHAHRQRSLRVGNVLLAADALFGRRVLERYPIPFGQDVGAQLASARALGGMEVATTIPGHGDPTDDLDGLVADNVAAIERVVHTVEHFADGLGTEQLLQRVCDHLEVELGDVARYHLTLCTLSAHLSYLRSEGRLDIEIADNRLVWRKG